MTEYWDRQSEQRVRRALRVTQGELHRIETVLADALGYVPESLGELTALDLAHEVALKLRKEDSEPHRGQVFYLDGDPGKTIYEVRPNLFIFAESWTDADQQALHYHGWPITDPDFNNRTPTKGTE